MFPKRFLIQPLQQPWGGSSRLRRDDSLWKVPVSKWRGWVLAPLPHVYPLPDSPSSGEYEEGRAPQEPDSGPESPPQHVHLEGAPTHLSTLWRPSGSLRLVQPQRVHAGLVLLTLASGRWRGPGRESPSTTTEG